MPKSTTAKAKRPEKPYPDFPLFAHASGRWAKKVRGAFAYFGYWADDPKGERAGELWAQQRDDLLAGRRPRKVSEAGVAVKEACDSFLTAKEQRVNSGELSRRSFDDYVATGKRVADAFGRGRIVADLAADDFRELRSGMAKVWGPTTINNEINRIRVLFRWVYEAGLIDKPVRYGPDFARASRKTLRKARAAGATRMFTAPELRKLINKAGLQLKAMILLGLNCGLGNSDCARLEFRHLDLKKYWLDYPRPKTEVDRRCPLWPETVKAIKAAIAKRPEPKDPEHESRVFITKQGRLWQYDHTRDSPLSHELAKLMDENGLPRDGRNFYSLRRVCETIGGEAKDQVAIDHIMGHAPAGGDMSAVYRQGISDERLSAVAVCIHDWLFATATRKRSAK